MSDVHDHDAFCCAGHSGSSAVSARLNEAEMQAKARGLRLTPVRRRTLEILLEGHGALGAYQVLDRLSAEGFGHQPPVAYRALNFLVEQGFAHRIRRLNAFTACTHPGEDHTAAFLICETCESVTEADGTALASALGTAAQAAGFALHRTTIEALGRCRLCAAGAPA